MLLDLPPAGCAYRSGCGSVYQRNIAPVERRPGFRNDRLFQSAAIPTRDWRKCYTREFGNDDLVPATASPAGPSGLDATSEFPLPVLLVAPDLENRLYLQRVVTQAGCAATMSATAEDALQMLTLIGGFELTLIYNASDIQPRDIFVAMSRRRLPVAPPSVIFLADEYNADEVVEALTAGASDYITGPQLSDERVLLARLQVALRNRSQRSMVDHGTRGLAPVKAGNITLYPNDHRVTIDDTEQVQLTPVQFRILYRLARRAGRVFLHVELRQLVGEPGDSVDNRTVKSHMFHLRKRLGDAGKRIKTVRGLGYVLEK